MPLNQLGDTTILTVQGEEIDMTQYLEVSAFKGWVADVRPNLRSGTFRIIVDTEGTDPTPHAPMIGAFGEMLVIQVYRLRRHDESTNGAGGSNGTEPPS